jgi:hypothetical protein
MAEGGSEPFGPVEDALRVSAPNSTLHVNQRELLISSLFRRYYDLNTYEPGSSVRENWAAAMK